MGDDFSVAQETRGQRRRLRRALAIAGSFTAALWGIRLLESLAGIDLSGFGIYPRTAAGMAGIAFGPLIHSSFEHLLANTAPCLVLFTALFYGYPRAAWRAAAGIYIGSGAAVWLLARSSYHIGASGLTFGLLFFVFVIGILRRDKPAIALALSVFLLYGGVLAGLLPVDAAISYESHIAGAISGTVLAVLLRHADPPPPVRRYSWEAEEEPVGEAAPDRRPPASGDYLYPPGSRTLH